jgi:hypothetical protein
VRIQLPGSTHLKLDRHRQEMIFHLMLSIPGTKVTESQVLGPPDTLLHPFSGQNIYCTFLKHFTSLALTLCRLGFLDCLRTTQTPNPHHGKARPDVNLPSRPRFKSVRRLSIEALVAVGVWQPLPCRERQIRLYCRRTARPNSPQPTLTADIAGTSGA